MRIRVLGSSAGGGLPQWNCHCNNCDHIRLNKPFNGEARTQSSIALTDTGEHWILFNASPDIRQQINKFIELHEGQSIRGTRICAVMLVDSQIDHTIGLLILREGTPINLYCTEQVYEDLTTSFPLIRLLDHYCGVKYTKISPGKPIVINELPHIELTPIGILSKAPPYSPHRNSPHYGDNIGFQIVNKKNKKKLLYAPAIEKVDADLLKIMQQMDYLLIDGTFWTEDDMQAIHFPYKKASEMGHLPYLGKQGMIAALSSITCPKTLIHINNTNPVLNKDSQEYQQLIEAGFQLSFDGMEIIL